MRKRLNFSRDVLGQQVPFLKAVHAWKGSLGNTIAFCIDDFPVMQKAVEEFGGIVEIVAVVNT